MSGAVLVYTPSNPSEVLSFQTPVRLPPSRQAAVIAGVSSFFPLCGHGEYLLPSISLSQYLSLILNGISWRTAHIAFRKGTQSNVLRTLAIYLSKNVYGTR